MIVIRLVARLGRFVQAHPKMWAIPGFVWGLWVGTWIS